MSFRESLLFKRMTERLNELPEVQIDIRSAFAQFSEQVFEESKYILQLFPEYTPHDETRHLSHLFFLADKILGSDTYESLDPLELVLLVFGLYCHDWGMAISQSEAESIKDASLGGSSPGPDQLAWGEYIRAVKVNEGSSETAWPEFIRRTHGLRSGRRARVALEKCGTTFADAVGKLAEGHTLDIERIKDSSRYPQATSVLGRVCNLQALACYVRMIDLLDIGDDRTPFALWKFVNPHNLASAKEWSKHRSLSPIAVDSSRSPRVVVVSGSCADAEVLAVLEDLHRWVQDEFQQDIALIRSSGQTYDPGLDSIIAWRLESPPSLRLIRFEFDRPTTFAMLSRELYGRNRHVFIRELLQNSVDAIDSRRDLLQANSADLAGEIQLQLDQTPDGLRLTWRDNGIGMTLETVDTYFSKLGRSWYSSSEFISSFHHQPISKFGIGVISCFAVTESMEIETRCDPLLNASESGRFIRIRERLSFFQIEERDLAKVGTSISFLIAPNGEVTASTIAAALEEYAGFIAHRITIIRDGVETEIQPLSTRKVGDLDEKLARHLSVRSFHSGIDEELARSTRRLDLHLIDPGNTFEAYYSQLVPVRPETVRYRTGSGYRFDSDGISVDPYQLHREGLAPSVYVKGVYAGEFPTGRSWIQPSLLVNIKKSSLIDPNLARSTARLDPEASDHIWREVAKLMKEELRVSGDATSAQKVQYLTLANHYGAVPLQSIDWFDDVEWPVLVLSGGQGLQWLSAGSLLAQSEILETPSEVSYRLDQMVFVEGFESSLQSWVGPDALVIGRGTTNTVAPGVGAVSAFSRHILEKHGFNLQAIRILGSPLNEDAPFACPVWVRQSTDDPAQRVVDVLWNEGPRLVTFPSGHAGFAAFGSLFWNREHPKIQAILRSLAEISAHQHEFSLLARQYLTAYSTPSGFVGYLVAARYPGRKMAIERLQKVLDIGRKEGLVIDSASLLDEDFVPGTLSSYSNPYHYDFHSWKGQPVGTPLA